MTMTTRQLFELAQQLTGSHDINVIVDAAEKIRNFVLPSKDVKELIEKFKTLPDFKPATNVVEFANQMKTQHPIRGAVDFKLWPYQEEILETFDTKHNLIFMKAARQLGIGTLAACYALWTASQKPDQTVVLVDMKLAHAIYLLERVKYMTNSTKYPLPGVRESNNTMVLFDNGSKILARSAGGSCIDNLEPNLVIIDEAAYISYKTMQVTWLAVRDLLPRKNIQVIIQSTPRYTEGPFYELWQKTEYMGAQTLEYRWNAHPERDQQWADAMKANMGPDAFEREMNCQFTSPPARFN